MGHRGPQRSSLPAAGDLRRPDRRDGRGGVATVLPVGRRFGDRPRGLDPRRPPAERPEDPPHFHLRVAEPREVLAISTGIVAGLFHRAAAGDGGSPVDFEELLALLTTRFGIDVHRSLGVGSDEDALFILYQLASRDSYAPGDSGANLHLLVLKPTGPAARLPWFAA